MKISLSKILLVLILVLGFFLRTYRLDSVPSGFFADEADTGYNAYTILRTGRDEHGLSYPIFFKALGDYKNPIAIYSTVPFIKIFGLNELGVRLQSVFYGMLTIFFLYLIGKEMISKSFGAWTAFIAATMSWLMHYNRFGVDYSAYTAFFTFVIYSFLRSVKNKNWIIPFFAIAGFTLYTYQPAKLILLLLLSGILFIYGETFTKRKKEGAIGIVLLLFISIPLLMSFSNGEATARFNMVSVFSAKLSIGQSILRSAQNYLIQLSPLYFITGEPTFITRHFVGGLTPLLIATLPFLFIGIIYTLLTIKNNKTSQLLTYWLFIYPIAGAVTADAPFTGRSIIGAPLFAIFIALGIIKTIKHLPFKKIAAIIIILLITGNTLLFLQFYFIKYPLYSSDFWGWQYGAREIVQHFEKNQSKYDELFMAPEFNAPEIFFKFYAPKDCFKCKIGTPDSLLDQNRKQLFAVTPQYLATHRHKFIIKKTIYYPNKQVAFQIGEVVQ